jgi:hypothetical protein
LVDELEALWLAHVRDRGLFQYVVSNEHWGGLVVAIWHGVGVLILPRPGMRRCMVFGVDLDGLEVDDAAGGTGGARGNCRQCCLELSYGSSSA